MAALVDLWTDEGIAESTIAGRFTCIRWWVKKVGRAHVANTKHIGYELGARKYRSELSRAINVADRTIDTVKDAYVRASLLLAKEFGLHVLSPCDTTRSGGQKRLLVVKGRMVQIQM